MENLTCDQFKEWCENTTVNRYIYDTGNQEGEEDVRVRFSLTFPDLFVASNPGAIYLKDTNNTMYIGNVKSICIHKKSAIGIVFDIVYCDQINSNNRCVTLIAQ